MNRKLDFEEALLKLENNPRQDEIRKCLKYFDELNLNEPQYLRVVQYVIGNLIPRVYNVLDTETKRYIIDYLSSLEAFGNIVNQIKIFSSNSSGNSSKVVLETLLSAVNDLFASDLLYRILEKDLSSVKKNELNKLFFRGYSFSIINEVSLKEKVSVGKVFSSSEKYSSYCYNQLLLFLKSNNDIKAFNYFCLSLKSFNSQASNILYDLLFQRKHFAYLKTSFDTMKRFEKRDFISSLFVDYIDHIYLRRKCSVSTLPSLAFILGAFFDKDAIDSGFLQKVLKKKNFRLNSLVSLTAYKKDTNLCKDLLSIIFNMWCDESSISADSISTQEYQTHFILDLLSYCTDTIFLKSLMESQVFLSSISLRLSSFSEKVRIFGILVSNKLCEQSNRKKIFEMDVSEFSYLLESGNDDKRESFNDLKSAFDSLEEGIICCDEETIEARIDVLDKNMNAVSLQIQDSDDDSDYESLEESEDPSVPSAKRILKPIYITDLIDYFLTSRDDSECYAKRKSALATAPTLIRQKAEFGTEVSDNADRLIECIVGLSNDFEDVNFDNEQMLCIVAVLSSATDSMLHICDLLLTGDYSLKQRTSILAAISVAARELRGYSDDIVINSYKKKVFPTAMLPGAAHFKFSSSDDVGAEISDSLLLSVEDELMAEPSETAKDKLYGPRILRVSRRLHKRNKSIAKPLRKNFGVIISSKFFYPLTNIIYQSGTFDIGHYSSVLLAFYLRTIALVLHAAYPIAPDMNDMIHETFSLIRPIVKNTGAQQLQLVESIITCGLLLCDMAEDIFLLEHHSKDLKLLQDWLSFIWDNIIDDKIKSLGAALLLRVKEIDEGQSASITDTFESFM